MEYEDFDVKNKLIQMTLVIKLHQLRRESLPFIEYDILETYVDRELWKDDCPHSLSRATEQIMAIEAQDIVRFEANLVKRKSSRSDIEEFIDAIGGN